MLKLLVELDDEHSAHELVANLESEPSNSCQLFQRRNLTGEEATWIVIATLAVQALGPTLGLVEKWLELRKVKSITVGDTKIENPGREDIQRLLEKRER